MTEEPTRYEALLKVVDCYGSQVAMADAHQVAQPTVWRWINQSKQLPAEHVLLAEANTGISRHHLRPDIYPVEHQPIPHPAAFQGVDRGTGRVSFNRTPGMKAAQA